MSTTSCTRRTKCVTMGNPCNISELDFQPVFEVPNEPLIVINGLPDATLSQATNILNTTSNHKSSNDDIDPCFGNWLEGREIQKNSQDKTCQGKVEKYDKIKNWYRVVYQDGGSEDLEWKQLREILVPLDISIPLTTLAAKMCKSVITNSSKGKRKKSDPAQISHPQTENENVLELKPGIIVKNDTMYNAIKSRKHDTNSSMGKRERSEPAQISHPQEENKNVLELTLGIIAKNDTGVNATKSDSGHLGAFVGRNVLKWSGNQHSFGEVKKYEEETKRYSVVYEDGNCEELEGHELENLLVPIKKQRKMRVNRLGGKEKMVEMYAIGSRALIESIDSVQRASMIEKIDAVKTVSLIEKIDACSQVKNPVGCSNDYGTGEKQRK